MRWFIDNSEILARFITILGFPIAIVTYFIQSKRQQKDRETGTYSSLDDKYSEYLKLCVDRPELGMFHMAVFTKPTYDKLETVQRYAMFEMLLSMFERAFLMMHDDHRSKSRKRQWNGWEEYLKFWIGHPDFHDLWGTLGHGFDSAFVKYVDDLKAPTAAGG